MATAASDNDAATLEAHGITMSSKEPYVNIQEKTVKIWRVCFIKSLKHFDLANNSSYTERERNERLGIHIHKTCNKLCHSNIKYGK